MRKTLTSLICLLVVALVSFAAQAQVKAFDPANKINATTGVAGWRGEVKRAGLAFLDNSTEQDRIDVKNFKYPLLPTECRATEELGNVILCASYLQGDMNRIFARISAYSEGAYEQPAKTLLPIGDENIEKAYLTLAGYDLPSTAVSSFFEETLAKCKAGKLNYCLNTYEEDFYEKVYKPLKARGTDFAIISFSVQSTYRYTEVINHEIEHAQYFVSEIYRTTVDTFWQDVVTEQDKSIFRDALNKEGYNASNEYLVKNEFQAYLFGPDLAKDKITPDCKQILSIPCLCDLAPKYRSELAERLTKVGVPPIQVN